MQRITNNILRNKTSSSVSTAVLGRKDVLAVLRKQIAVLPSQTVILSQQTAPKETKLPLSAPTGQETPRSAREKAMASRTSEMWSRVKPMRFLDRFYASYRITLTRR